MRKLNRMNRSCIVSIMVAMMASVISLPVSALEKTSGKFTDIFRDAVWIGAGENMPFYPDYLPVFRIDCDIKLAADDKCSLLYGVDDPRLMNGNLNIYNLANQTGKSAIKIEISGGGKISIYRYGYHPDDSESKPLAVFDADVRQDNNHLTVISNMGNTDIMLNGVKIGKKGVNPVGNGGDYLAFPVLADMGVEIPSGCNAVFSNIKISNLREPGNILYEVPGIYRSTATLPLGVRSMPELRGEINLQPDRKLTDASLHATARGVYDVYINGKRITDDYFYPGSTQYNKTHLYQKFDILPFLRKGKNEILVRIGEGWWCGGATYIGENWNFYGDRPSFIAVADMNYEDGSTDRIVTTPKDWKYSVDGPVVVGSFFQGEIYDNAKEDNLSARVWKPAVEIALDSTVNKTIGNWDEIEFLPGFGDRVMAVDTIKAVSMSEPRPGVYVYDMGQNMAGVPYILFNDLRSGQEVTVRHAEILYPDMPEYADNSGMIMTENLRAAMCRDIYKASGKKGETFSPRFTLHGYRYLELTGIDEPLPLDNVRSIPVSSIHGFKAHYECSDTLVNRLWENIKWSSLSNFISIPTDCPQRNERLGWMGDISVFAPTATKLADVSALLEQYLHSVRDCQADNGRFPDVVPTGCGFGGLLWGSAGVTVPWEHFKHYRDTSVIRTHYPAMKRYIDYIFHETMDPETGIIVQDRAWGDLADWLSPEYNRTDKSLLWECYLIYDLEIMREIATILGYEDEAGLYEALRRKRVGFFKDNYIDPVTNKTVWSGYAPSKKGTVIDTQVSYALPIALGIYEAPEFVANFVNTVTRENVADDGTTCPPYSLMTGFIGTAWIEDALSRSGHTETAYRLLTNTAYPSWLYPVTQGATTVWERLNSYTHKNGFGKNNSMNSFNHYSFGSVGNWLLSNSLGINFTDDDRIIISPEPDTGGSINYAKGWLDTPAGKVESAWEIVDGDVMYEFVLPENVEGIFRTDDKIYALKGGVNRFKLPLKFKRVVQMYDPLNRQTQI